MPNPAVDKRKLKDSVAEYLKRGKVDKAVEALERLVIAEPKDTNHKLKLGDCYRKLDRPEKAIVCYQSVVKAFNDLGLLGKGISVAKVIFEIDPRNAEARRDLGELHQRRFGKPLPEDGAVARGKSALATPNGSGSITPILTGVYPAPEAARASPLDDLFEDVDASDGQAPLDRDDPSAPITDELDAGTGPSQQRGELEFTPEDLGEAPAPPESKPSARARLDKSIRAPPPPARRGTSLELDPGLQDLPDENLFGDEPEDLATAPDDDEVLDLRAEAAPELARGPWPSERRRTSFDLGPGPQDLPAENIFGDEPGNLAMSRDDAEVLDLRAEVAPAPGGSASGRELDAAVSAISAKARHSVPTTRVPLFDVLGPSKAIELINQLPYRRYGAGQEILNEGDPGRSLFVIAKGKVRIWKNIDGNELTLAHLEDGAFFGETALLAGAPRTANVSALSETELLEVTDGVLRDIAKKHPSVMESVKTVYRQRLLSNVMTISPIFRDFSPADRKQIVARFKVRPSAAGEVLVKEGKASDGLFVVLHGTVEMSAQNVSLARLKQGDLFGEMSMLSREPASATVTSPGNTLLLRLGRAEFQELVAKHPQLLALVSYLSAQRDAANRAALKNQG